MGIISISGNSTNSGKDLVGKIIQYLTFRRSKEVSFNDFLLYYQGKEYENFKIKKFADKLKDIVCILLDCTREDLENEEFKNKELGEDWDKLLITFSDGYDVVTEIFEPDFNTETLLDVSGRIAYIHKKEILKLTPRLLLQLLGTECGRDIIHPNIWCNSLMRNYKAFDCVCQGEDGYCGEEGERCNSFAIYPNWIITDLRFPNEYKAVQKHEHLHIHLERFKVGDKVTCADARFENKNAEWEIFECYEDYALIGISGLGNREKECEAEVPYSEISLIKDDTHKSENTDLLKEYFDKNIVYLYNVGDIEELVEKVKTILIKNKIIKNE